MPLPKKVKPNLPLVPDKTLLSRREELLEFIQKDGTYLPKSVLHADLDRGMLDFVKNDLRVVVEGKEVPTIDVIITTQNWAQYTETSKFVDLDFNPSPPFITLVRSPEVKYGTNPSLLYTIPDRRQYHYASVPTWNGNQVGMDIYTIPQPIPVDINYSLKIICNRMRELNQLNKVVMQKFSSRQAYTFIKGQYVPIVLNNIGDESQMNVDSRKYFVQTYDFTMLGYLIDEDEFEVKPAIQRVAQVYEVDISSKGTKRKVSPENPDQFVLDLSFFSGTTELVDQVDFSGYIEIVNLENVINYDIFINSQYYGSNLDKVQVSTNDILTIKIIKALTEEQARIIINNRFFSGVEREEGVPIITPSPQVTPTLTPTPTSTPSISPLPVEYFAYIFPEPQDSSSLLSLGQYMYDTGASLFFGFGNSGPPDLYSYSNDLTVYASYSGFTLGGGSNFKVPVSTLKSTIRQSSGTGTDTFGCEQQQYTFGTMEIDTDDINVSLPYFYSIWIPTESIPISWSNMKVMITREKCSQVINNTIPSPSLASIVVNVGSGSAIPEGSYRVLWMPYGGYITPELVTNYPIYFKGENLII